MNQFTLEVTHASDYPESIVHDKPLTWHPIALLDGSMMEYSAPGTQACVCNKINTSWLCHWSKKH